MLVLMGVSGTGKTTIGRLLAADRGWTFIDADDFHPAANQTKMASGQALNDTDRWPWLRFVRRSVEDRQKRGESVVLACSALKQSYRDLLTRDLTGARCVYLRGDAELIAGRLQRRQGHFMPPELLASQLEALEEPSGEAWVVDISDSPEAIVAQIRARLDP